MVFRIVEWKRGRGSRKGRSSERGGAAIEYVLVSTFGLLVTLGAIGMLGRVFERKYAAAAEKLGISGEALDVSRMFDGGGAGS